MKRTTVNINGQILTDSQTDSLDVALDMARLNLETLSRERLFGKISVSEHLRNLNHIIRVLHEETI